MLKRIIIVCSCCHDYIQIGEGVEFGPCCLIYDHDFRSPDGPKEEAFKTAPEVVGNNCWIGANTVILRGTTLGNNCVICGARSVSKGKFLAGTVII